MPSLAIAKLRRRLERAELEHLRQVCAEQGARIEALEAELDEAWREATWADQRADMFHDLANNLAEQADAYIGITRTGELGVVAATAAH
jgi:predicted site-specific integrase-resolvase